MKLSLKAKTLISVGLFLVVFVALILIATFCDYQVSEILTNGVLAEGEYFANDFFGIMLECVGCLPIYLMIAFVLCVLFWSSLKLWDKKPLNIIVAVACGIGTVVACWFGLKDSISYLFEHTAGRVGAEAYGEIISNFKHSAAVVGVEVVFAAIMAALALLATKHFKPETLKKLIRFSIAAVIAIGVANLLIMIIKDPVGRMRFRAINSDLGQALIGTGKVQGYTPWYVANGQPNEAIQNAFLRKYGVSDAFKSFPSGHTCSAGSVNALIMIPALFDFANTKSKKQAAVATTLCWALPILYTMLVAISRIMVGAHYMSDVTFGGTIVFVCMAICCEIFIHKGSHFFAVFPKLQKQKVANNSENADLQAVSDVENNENNDAIPCDEESVNVANDGADYNVVEEEETAPSEDEASPSADSGENDTGDNA